MYAFTFPSGDPVVATPAASVLPGYVEGLAIATVHDVREAQDVCGSTPYGDVGKCDQVVGCEYWNGRCGLQCARLATGAACHEATGGAWDETLLHCGWIHPTCEAVTQSTHCAATKFCTWDSDTGTCARAAYECEDLIDEQHCEKSASPECAWRDDSEDRDEDDETDTGSNSTSGSCADLRQCETITLPSECSTHRGCAFSQQRGACVSLNQVAVDKAMCVTSSQCAVADTFCNLDFGSKGYCQNCLPLVERGKEVCVDDIVVAAPAAQECKDACFAPDVGGVNAFTGG